MFTKRSQFGPDRSVPENPQLMFETVIGRPSGVRAMLTPSTKNPKGSSKSRKALYSSALRCNSRSQGQMGKEERVFLLLFERCTAEYSATMWQEEEEEKNPPPQDQPEAKTNSMEKTTGSVASNSTTNTDASPLVPEVEMATRSGSPGPSKSVEISARNPPPLSISLAVPDDRMTPDSSPMVLKPIEKFPNDAESPVNWARDMIDARQFTILE